MPTESGVLLDSIIDVCCKRCLRVVFVLIACEQAVGAPGEASVRDFAAKCLAEFLRWSVKHYVKAEHKRNPVSVRSLFKRLYSLAHHPNAYKRLG